MSVSAERLQTIVEAIESLEGTASNLRADIREQYATAKLEGFDPKVLRQVVRLRKREQEEVDQERAVLDLYLSALGMSGDESDE